LSIQNHAEGHLPDLRGQPHAGLHSHAALDAVRRGATRFVVADHDDGECWSRPRHRGRQLLRGGHLRVGGGQAGDRRLLHGLVRPVQARRAAAARAPRDRRGQGR